MRRGPGRRGVFGKSSGGYGAAWHGMHRADFWSAISINSGDMGFDALYIPALLDDLELLRTHDYSIETFWKATIAKNKMSFREQMVLMDLAQGAFYDPDPTQFMNMRLPLDPYTGEFIPERWANWLAHDPVVMLDTLGDNLRKLKFIYMDCGDHDNFRIHLGMRRFAKKLRAAGIAHTYEEFDDDHMDVDYRMDVFLPVLAKALTFNDATVREDAPQTPEKVFRAEAGTIDPKDPASVYSFVVAEGDADGVELGPVSLVLERGSQGADPRARPVGLVVIAIGAIAFLLSLRAGSSAPPANPNSQPPPRWGRGADRN